MTKPSFEDSTPRNPTDSELQNTHIDAYLFEDYSHIDGQIDLIVSFMELGRKDLVRDLIVKDFRVVFMKGALAHAKNPRLSDELKP